MRSAVGMPSSTRAPRHLVVAVVALALGVGLTPLAGSAVPAGLPGHAAIADAARGLISRSTRPRQLSHEVYGYLPYWRIDNGTAGRLDYHLLSTIAVFGIGITPGGGLTTTAPGYRAYVSPNGAAIINAAHAHGVRVVPVFQLFDSGALPTMRAFLASASAQRRFIATALRVLAARRADGANLDFEPMPASLVPAYLAFVRRFRTALRAHLPGGSLVSAVAAGAPAALISGLAPLVDAEFAMAYDYAWTGSTAAGPVAPLDGSGRTVRSEISRFLRLVPASKVILGTALYGYDWPVTSPALGAPVRRNRAAYGGVISFSYAAAQQFLASHPGAAHGTDVGRGGAWYTYYDRSGHTFRQAWYESAQSLAAKFDFALASRLRGVGLWALGNDTGYSTITALIRSRFYAPVHRLSLVERVSRLYRQDGHVKIHLIRRVTNGGSVPEQGVLTMVIRDSRNRVVRTVRTALTAYPGRVVDVSLNVALGRPWRLPAGRYTIAARFDGSGGTWSAPSVSFRQPY